ncbi:MAG TPA: CHC2 zinc finger domain-containing protein [Sphingomonadaceae bacterium]|nr:CHC2 zinc finger domain-containing protein [Sphingomonadaceae bacterium]
MIDLHAIRAANPLPSIVGATVKLQRAGREYKACCPFHPDRSPSFTIFADGERFHCFGCGASGDVLDFVQRAYAVRLPEAARMLGAGDMPRRPMPSSPEASDGADTRAKRARALAIWHRAKSAAGTLAEAYLRFRGILPPYPPDLRFLRLRCGNLGALPCLVAAVRDVAGTVIGIQRIWLAGDGQGKAAITTPKRSLGQVKGGAIRLGKLDGTGWLTVCEGPEDGLSLRNMLGGPVWVAAGATFLPAMQFPPEVRTIVIGADNDPAGCRAAEDAAQAYAGRGLSVRIIRPLSGCKDFNDELRGRGNGC